ncbi:long-chain fatty acid--CoA ligase [Treponema sp. OMZ 840]|uniref:AMP-dependent synthetase/ligase n=1 Tax=Treponema sp. OMZ 840 TaxID=244313 RepID=UPI003D907DCF
MYKKSVDKTLPVNLPLLFQSRAKMCPFVTAQAAKNSKGVFKFYGFKKVYEQILLCALALKDIGITKGTHVALISDNRREWLITDFALLSLGAVDVPRGCDSTANELHYIISFADCTYGVFENMHQLNKVLNKIPQFLKTVILFEKASKDDVEKVEALGLKLYDFHSLMKRGKNIGLSHRGEIEDGMSEIKGSDLATIIFTSGTTNIPKGVMLTHRNYIAQLEVVHTVLTVQEGDMWLSVLPVWHSFERVMQYIAITLKSGIAYSKPVSHILLSDMNKIKPQWICGVPRLWEALANGIYRTMRKEGGIAYSLFVFFIDIGKRFTWAKERVYGRVCRYTKKPRIFDFLIGIFPFLFFLPLYILGDLLVYRKIRKKFGGRITAAISGGGALAPKIDEFYRAINFKLLEGYGVTEAAPVLSVRDCIKPRPGCVGIVYPSVQIKIVPEKDGCAIGTAPLSPGRIGLIFARGEQIMKGYYKNDDLTSAVIDSEGWFNTGDLGMLSFDNEIKITGRAKDTIVLSGGENIEPVVIEKALCVSSFIETAFVTGQNQKYLGALIVPDREDLRNFAKQNNLLYTDYQDLLQLPQIQKLIRSEIDSLINEHTGFRYCEHIYRFCLLPNSFVIGRELSAKQEFMRHKIHELYKVQIESLF